jgi:hypothetical protein
LPDEPLGLSEKLRPLFLYWVAARGEKLMPSRADIDPVDMPRKLLPNIVLVDALTSPSRFRYRVMGTEITAMLGLDWTGRFVDELPEAGRIISEQYTKTVNDRAPAVYVDDSKMYDASLMQHKLVRYERLLLPMSDDGSIVSMLLGATLTKSISW